ncbi:MAG: hypothetical protein WC010_01905 [Candidatus Absconditabacterales bacterium]
MKDKFISYDHIIDGQDDIPKELDKNPSVDPFVTEDLVTLFKMKEIFSEMDNFIEMKENKLDILENKLHYTYDEFGARTDYEYREKRSKNMLENTKWKEEVSLVKEQDKIEILMHMKEKGLIIDKLNFVDEDDINTICLSVVIGDISNVGNEDEDPCVFLFPEFILNMAGNVELPSEDDQPFEINIDQIKEIIVEETKYIFLF